MTLTTTSPGARGKIASVGNEPYHGERHVCNDMLTDAELLKQFIVHRQEDSFAQMVRRHGPMVLRTCQRIVGHAFDADDAFQAVFMVLARKASSVRPPDMLGPWLHGVACRCGLALKQKLYRLRQREHALGELVPMQHVTIEARDWLLYLDQEIQRLPEIYRKPVVLCELQGHGRKEAAKILGVAEGTLSSRLASARKRLAKRLGHRGLLSVAALVSWAALNNTSYAALPEKLVESTTQLGMKLTLQPATAALSPTVAHLTQGALQSMFITKCKSVALFVIGFGCLSYGCWFVGDAGAKEPELISSAVLANSENADPQDKSSRKQKPESNSQETVTGSGKLVTTTRSVSDFNTIHLLNAGKLTIKQTGKEKLKVTTDDNILPLLLTEVNDSVLTLKNSKPVNLKPTKDNEYVIEVKELSKLEIKGAGTITVEKLDGKQLDIEVQGAGTVQLEGRTGNLVVNLSGAGTVNAEKLTSGIATISIPGSGSVTVNANEKLSASINGAGSIQYLGNPEVSKTIRGAGSVKRMSPVNKDPIKP